MNEKLLDIVNAFELNSPAISISSYGGGHINETYLVETRNEKKFILQKINHAIFSNVAGLMENACRISNHLAGKREQGEMSPWESMLSFIATKDNAWFFSYKEKSRQQLDNYTFWRMYHYVDGVQSFDACDSPQRAYQAAEAFGRFAYLISDLPNTALNVTIEKYHDGSFRFEQLQAELEIDKLQRAKNVAAEINFALERKVLAATLIDALRNGIVPERNVHNDTKLNNLLFCSKTSKAVCVIDLDTCMTGSALFDFGDLARNTAIAVAEDEPDLDRVQVKMDYFSALVDGYIKGTAGMLTKKEIELFPLAPRVFALTLGMRFLADYLRGDTYFRIHHPDHNLQRTRTQFEIVRKMEMAEAEMRSCLPKP